MTIPPNPHPEQVEKIAQIIEPHAFKEWQSQYEYCLRAGDDEIEARACADDAYKPTLDAARSKADDILASLANRPADDGVMVRRRTDQELIDECDWASPSGMSQILRWAGDNGILNRDHLALPPQPEGVKRP